MADLHFIVSFDVSSDGDHQEAKYVSTKADKMQKNDETFFYEERLKDAVGEVLKRLGLKFSKVRNAELTLNGKQVAQRNEFDFSNDEDS